jgi:hypothetical protein
MNVTEQIESMAASWRATGDAYAAEAEASNYLPRIAANAAEAAKYYEMANRLESTYGGVTA